ncbi:TIGR04282 family arsenosugar biosynthesis glycosyltransferase [Algoriphagus sp. C2-6-M1]|uniref:TIGR04282 family arsenosugar biosynthesis glycosyltransferase n=1 Tax=Algoriphagus persicinus TaxID=3108754 RepID=UPI002B3FBA71|nr:TIGR04282 family arsenosugar biosynthesis glycosyltransferase [Algoriphagus sp. C2-6-M1]MEB2779335.1 TIGR04282 family arsenosugar biosynthesis glycosyltransferase [Algoriphagus sp. C2-6-M1]
MKEGIVIFQKNAELGKVKTRLSATIGDQKAFEAYQLLVNVTHKIASQCPAQKILFFSNHLEVDSSVYPENYRFELQSGQDLGDKMSHALQRLFQENFDRLVIIGTDCPEITPKLISKAFEELEESEVVIGPATDGGYYLLGMTTFISGLFEGIPWSTDQVAALTIEYLKKNEITFALLPTLSDVDFEADWNRFKDKL